MTVKGTIRPLGSKVLISNMNFGMEKTRGGILLHSDDAKSSGIHPRWGKVFAVGPEQKEVNVGQWILLEHGRWSRGHKYESENGETFDIRLADTDAILVVSDEEPNDAMRVTPGTFNLNVPNQSPT
jgi:co-chaperonin GroES (HSP10)